MYKKRMSLRQPDRVNRSNWARRICRAGIPHSDEFFGEMEIYRDEADCAHPDRAARAGRRISWKLEIALSGLCADIGLCYPPQVWTSAVTLDKHRPAGKLETPYSTMAQATGTGNGSVAGSILHSNPSYPIVSPFELQVNWTIADGYYLYRDSVKISATGDVAQPGNPVHPCKGTPKWDEHFGDTRGIL